MLVLTVLWLSACSQSDSTEQERAPDKGVSQIAIPSVIRTAALQAGATLIAEVYIDYVDSNSEPRDIRSITLPISGNVSFTLSNIPVGSHRFTIIFKYTGDLDYPGTFELARATSDPINIVSGSNPDIQFTDIDFDTRADSDRDGIFNLVELKERSNPNSPSYYIFVTVSGLVGSGAVLQLNGGSDLTLTADGLFPFRQPIDDNIEYTVTVATQPSSPNQTCDVTNSSGTVRGENVTSVTVNCSAATATFYSVSVSVSGLVGSGLVLQNNGGDNLTINADGSYPFSTTIADGSPYNVTVQTQPASPDQTCTVTNGSGTINGANITVTVACNNNTAPIANAGPDQTVRTGDTVTLDGSASSDANGDSLTYSWTLVSIPTGSAAALSNAATVNPTFIADVAGSYEIRLIVNDGTTDSAADFVTISTAVENKVVFVTSVTGSVNFASWADAGGATGLAAADAVCKARASIAGLSGTFMAWLSDNVDDAYCRIHELTGKKSANCGQSTLPVAAGPWVRTDGFPFSGTIDQLVNSGVVYSPIMYDEFANPVAQNLGIYTGTYRNGTMGSLNCSNWTSTSFSEYAVIGTVQGTTAAWTDYAASTCNGSARLLCFETGVGALHSGFQQSGKIAFVTSVSGNGDLSSWLDAGGSSGIAAGDAICQARASAAGWANASVFKAWLSNSLVDAQERILSTGPWVRPDGVIVATDKTDLLDGILFTGISQDEFGNYAGSNRVWTGTAIAGLRTLENCNDWSMSDNLLMGTRGVSSYTLDGWTNDYASTSCDTTSMHLYCFEDIDEGIIYVDASQTGQGDGTVGSPFASIQEGITQAISGQTVQVAAGDYLENIVMKSGVNVVGSGPNTTTILGQALVAGVVNFPTNVINARLEGFTLSVQAPIPGSDRGIYVSGGNTNTVIARNIITGVQYGIQVWGSSPVLIENNTLVSDADEQGIQFVSGEARAVIRNNIIIGYNLGIHQQTNVTGSPTIVYNDIFNNVENYRGIPDQTNINGNISADPLLDAIFTPIANSPVIDAGDPSSPNDLDGTRADMGALPAL